MRVLLFIFAVPLVYGFGGSRMVGAPEKSDVNSATNQDMAIFALEKVNEVENSDRNLVTIVSARTQVVAGINYFLKLKVKNGDTVEECDVTVYDVVWTKERTLTEHACKQVADEGAAVMAAVDYHNHRLNSMYWEEQLSVDSMQKQEVAETGFTFVIHYLPTTCIKISDSQGNMGKGLDECPVNPNGVPAKCFYVVRFKASDKPAYTVVTETCGDKASQTPLKSDTVSKLQGLFSDHKNPFGLMNPDSMLPGLGAKASGGRAGNPPMLRMKKSADNLQPLFQHIGKSVLEALHQAKDKNPELYEQGKEKLNNLLGNEKQDVLKQGLDKLLGGDGHDMLQHGLEGLLGGDGHDMKNHNLQKLLGGDDHDMINHEFGKLFGGDDHDMKPHGVLIGGDDHDMKPHGKLIGGDDHDMKPHGKMIGGDDHDMKPHGMMLGGDGHDMKPHGMMLGGDGHDMKPHGKLIGGDDHDMKPHGKMIGGDGHDMKPHGKLIGGDDHDMKPHGKMLGEDGDGLYHRGHFKEFMSKYGKTYDSEDEETKRFGIFLDNMKHARKLNESEQGTAVYGATKFADLTPEEFREMYLSKRKWDEIRNEEAEKMKQEKMWKAKIPSGTPPKAFDWRDHGAVTPVKNQGQCGSCWAFSTTGNIEGQWKLSKGDLVSLSEQELVDCDKMDEGCNGGLPSNAYMAIMKLGGLETETEYKYDGEDEKCKFNKTDIEVTISGAVNISSNEDDMAAWLAKNGPISIGINANAMQFYFGGISHPWKIFCNPSSLDHGVLIVGYGVEGSEPYWIVKNSWGPDWGEKGYYRVYRGGGVCGLNRMCTSAVV